MLITMKPKATEEDIRRVRRKIEVLSYRAYPLPGARRTSNGDIIADL